jgi:hypothetical protein
MESLAPAAFQQNLNSSAHNNIMRYGNWKCAETSGWTCGEHLRYLVDTSYFQYTVWFCFLGCVVPTSLQWLLFDTKSWFIRFFFLLPSPASTILRQTYRDDMVAYTLATPSPWFHLRCVFDPRILALSKGWTLRKSRTWMTYKNVCSSGARTSQIRTCYIYTTFEHLRNWVGA